MLTIRSADRGTIRVVIDGRRFEPSDNFMRIRGIESGYHRVRIYRERNNGFFTIFGNRYEVVFNSSIMIMPRTTVMITIDRFGRATISENRMSGWGWFDRDYNGYGDRDNRRPDERDDKKFGDRDDRRTGAPDNTDFGDNDDRNWDKAHDFDFDRDNKYGDYDNSQDKKFDGRDDRSYHDNGYNVAMNDFEFSRVLASIEKEWFENNKVKSATQIINTNYMTSTQVKQLLQLFTFESNKLDLAKQAYSKTTDQRNYFMVNDVFSFSSSKDELARYIRSYR